VSRGEHCCHYCGRLAAQHVQYVLVTAAGVSIKLMCHSLVTGPI
jgi:hypothetical protein